MKVSVVVPFLNSEQYLAEAVASVQAQTFTDWELLLVDDGSADGSSAIASAAARTDPRIHVLTRLPPASGNAAAARNLGLAHARGDAVAFLDSDDVYEPDYLETRCRELTAHPEVMVVYGPTRWWHPDDQTRDWTEDMTREAGRVHQPPELVNRILLLERGHVPCTCGVIVRRDAFDVTGGFDEGFHLYEDQTLWVKLLLRFPTYVSAVEGARYRQHTDSTTAHSERAGWYSDTQPHQARIAFLRWVRDYAQGAVASSRSVERALRIAFAPYPGEAPALTAVDRCLRAQYRAAAVLHRRWRSARPGRRADRSGTRLR